jgi:hypothetical protein
MEINPHNQSPIIINQDLIIEKTKSEDNIEEDFIRALAKEEI